MFKRFVPLVMLMGLIFLIAAACSGGSEPTATPARSSPPTIPPVPAATTATATPPPADSGGQSGTAFTVNLQDPGKSGDYMFSPSELSFSVGETVSFTLASETEFHTFTVDELGIDVSIDPGATQTLSFTFDTPGTYQLICIPHERLGMVGTITVR